MSQGNDVRLLTYGEVAELTQMSRRYVEELVRRGEIPAIRLGRKVRFHPGALDGWIRDVERQGGVS